MLLPPLPKKAHTHIKLRPTDITSKEVGRKFRLFFVIQKAQPVKITNVLLPT